MTSRFENIDMKVLIFAENDHSIPRRYWEPSIPVLRQKGIDVHFATIQQREELHVIFDQEGIPTYAFGGKQATDYFRVSSQLALLVRREKFDVVHASESISATLAGLACLLLRRRSAFFTTTILFSRETSECLARSAVSSRTW